MIAPRVPFEKKRIIKQIAVSEAGAENGYSRYVYALTQDGSIFEMNTTFHNVPRDWVKLPELPPLEDEPF